MSKHKRLHSITGKGKFAKFAGFVGTHYGLRRPAPKAQTFGIMNEEAPAGATNTDEGKVEKVLSVSTSYDNTNMKEDAR